MSATVRIDLKCCFGLFILFFVPVCESLLAAMSVDLGSEFLKIGLVKPGVPMEIVLNRESHRKTATLVGIKGQERTFSEQALYQFVKQPQYVYLHLPELLGKKFDNPLVELYHRRFPYLSMAADENRGTVIFKKEGEDLIQYSIEALIAMILGEARKLAESYAQQPVKDAVITVPPYFNQAERKALTSAAEMAGLNLLQLMNDNTAAGVNYGMFRRKEFNESISTVLIYDMGATKTTATVFDYQVRKDKQTSAKDPHMMVIGVGFDRTLGGLEMTLRLRDHFVASFQQQFPNCQQDLTDNGRAMAKLLKEANRVKHILSANADFVAQVESLHEDHDFKIKITREQLEMMCADLFDRVAQPVRDALKMAELNIDQIDTVVLMGGATRTPKVQELLQAELKGKELGKFLNTDDAIALGAVYQAAHLSKGFKVKKFHVHEMNLFPIEVDFIREGATEGEKRTVRRTLFNLKNPYPQKKVLTFSRHTEDFEFAVNYGDLHHLHSNQLEQFGSFNISRVDVLGLTDAYSKEFEGKPLNETTTEYKGVKAHFRMDESGILSLDSAEMVFERDRASIEQESTLSSIGNKIKSFFGGSSQEDSDKKDAKEGQEDMEKHKDSNGEEEKKPEESGKKDESEKKQEQEKKPAEEAANGKDKDKEKPISNEEKEKETKNETTQEATEKGPKIETVKNPLKLEQAPMGTPQLSTEEMRRNKKILSDFDSFEQEKAKKEQAINELESFLFETKDKIENEEDFKKVTTETEREKVLAEIKTVSDWMEDEADFETKRDEYEKRLRSLKKSTDELFYKVDEYRDRATIDQAMFQMINNSETFLKGIRALADDLQIFTDTEQNSLEKLINETKKWWEDKKVEQAKLADHDKPALNKMSAAEKLNALDREVKYLLNKAKFAKPLRPKTPPPATNTTATTDNTTISSDKEASTSAPDAEGVTKTPVGDTLESPAAKTAEESEPLDDTSSSAPPEAPAPETLAEEDSSEQEKPSKKTDRTDL